jgi:hypothetical protein
MTYVLRGVALGTGSVSLFWIVGILADTLLGYDPNPLLLLGFAAVVTGSFAIPVFSRWPRTLAIARSTAPSRFFSTLLLSTVHSYLAMVPICGIAAYVLVLLLGNPRANDVGMFVVLFAIWFPLWLAPGVGALWSCRRIRAGWKP